MAKFNLKEVKTMISKHTPGADYLKSGIYTARITQIVDLGELPGFNKEDPPVDSLGIAFQLPEGKIITKVFRKSTHSQSFFYMLISSIELPEDDFNYGQLTGKELSIEVAENGQYPKITACYSLDNQLSEAVKEWLEADLITLIPEEGEEVLNRDLHIEAIKKLQPELRKTLLNTPRKAS
jgi:hypothetical protein